MNCANEVKKCSSCGSSKHLIRPNHKCCDVCINRVLICSKAKRAKLRVNASPRIKKNTRAGWRKQGRCDHCGSSELHPGTSHCRTCLDRWKNARRRRHKRVRVQVLAAYGNRCACPGCKESRPEFLSIDHINGGGNQHKRELGIATSTDFYRWLIRNHYPKDQFRLLCYNCNLSRGFNGYCPHEKET